MSMSRKIFGIISLLVVLAVVIAALGVAGLGRINNSTEQLGRLAARSVNLTVMDVIVQKRAAATLRMIINTDPALIERQINEAFLPAEKAMEAELASYRDNFPANPTPEMKQWPAEIKKRWDAYVAATARVAELARNNSNDQALLAFRNEADPAFAALDSYTTELETVSISGQGEALATARALGSKVSQISIWVSAAGILMANIIAFLVVSRIVRQLRRIIDGLDDAAAQVASAASAVSESSVALAEGATEQAAALEESSAALEEVASMTRQNAESSRQTASTTDNTVKLIEDGTGDVHNMSQAMDEISDSANKIGQIIKTIEDIAFQTNLLALNAAVEAARAGEAGSGFAVVADEVRNLAQRSAQAARDTSELIKSTVTRIQNGSLIAERLDASFQKISEEAHGVGALVNGINMATGEQAQGVEQVNKAVTEMDKVTQSNAASAEECASASEELSAQAEVLKSMVHDLLALVAGGGGGLARAASSAGSPAPHRGPDAQPRQQLIALHANANF